MKPTERFSNRVENYVRFRPDYPPEITALMQSEMDLNQNSTVADIGSGTGIFARRLLETGCKVFGVEPNAAMQTAGAEFLTGFPNFESVTGTAESTNLPAESVDFVTAAQAFHWFDQPAAKAEFRRILRENGWLVLIWNVRKLDADAFSVDYENLLQEFGTDYKTVIRKHAPVAEISDFFDGDFREQSFENWQTLDFAGLKGRLLSSSYVPTEESETFQNMIGELENIFERRANAGNIKIYYDTKVYYRKF